MMQNDLERIVYPGDENKPENSLKTVPDTMYADEAAKYLKISKRKLSLLRKSGLIKAVRLNKHFLYRREWLNEFLDQNAGLDLRNESLTRSSIMLKRDGYR